MSKNNPVKKPTRKQQNILRTIIVLGIISLLNFFFWFFSPKYIGNETLYTLLIIVIVYTSLRVVYEWYHYWNISIPEPKKTNRQFTVDFLTTYFPGEPYDMIENTLLAIKNVRYPHTTILCDEADDARLKAFCLEHGIKHISRDNRIDAKAGNINNALTHIATGEICVILDPDHVPKPDFLDEIIPYFEDDQIGYVQIVQAYKNYDESYVAKGAAQQTFQFYGPMMMCMNSYGTVNAIGANCTFRRAALDSIGGHAPGLAEDMHTAMLLHSKGWKSVYVPKVLARGLVPSSLTAYYKQQLKWSRGTLELLVSVYPKIFKKISPRQRIHYATIPLHYLIGFIYLINFLIPIISLCTATTPWKGNILFFGLITIPLITCLLVVRSFVQRWVMEESERGFHMVGGLLLISTWWVFCVGALYTVLRKKVPYLPTPKTGEDKTSWKLLAPNIFIALASLGAIIYGLNKDFTPFSIFMSGFAALNIGFMMFSIYLANHKYTEIGAIKNKIKKDYYSSKLWVKQRFWNFRHNLYRGIRQVALPLVIASFIISLSLVYYDQYMKWEGVQSYPQLPVLPNKELGIYAPGNVNGLSVPEKARKTELELSTKFDLMAHYIPWGNTGQEKGFETLLEISRSQNYTPFITWEPWASTFDFSSDYADLMEERHIFKHITNGVFDNYLREVTQKLKAYNKKVYIRFAHEFDNPQYPWSAVGDNTPEDFKKAWTHIHEFFRKEGVTNVHWVWSPWKPRAIRSYYPGDSLVDVVGITALNYGEISPSGTPYSFDDLYLPLKDSLKSAHINKPVILSEFGSLNLENGQTAWINDALDSIYQNHPEIKGLLFFNSDIDKNIPVDDHTLTTLDWTLIQTKPMRYKLWELELEEPPDSSRYHLNQAMVDKIQKPDRLKLPQGIHGISYKKGQNWYKNYQVMDIKTVQNDFSRMKNLGINTVKYFGSPVYDHNMLRAAHDSELDIVYGLWLPESIGQEQKEMARTEERILKMVHKLKAREEIIAWNLGNDILTKINQYLKEENAREKISEYTIWLKRLLKEIKNIDPDRPVILDLDVNRHAIQNACILLTELPELDALALRLRSSHFNNEFLEFAKKANLPVLIGDVTPALLNTLNEVSTGYFLRNWQDQHESNLVSFDGILDHKGRQKQSYQISQKILANNLNTDFKERVRVLRPALPLKPGKEYEYHALLRGKDNLTWNYAPEEDNAHLEWTLVKCDRFGTPLALKDLGSGRNKIVEIPENYENYFLVLKYIEEEIVYSSEASLNLPNNNTEPVLVALYGL